MTFALNLFLAFVASVTVANLYYVQPLLAYFESTFSISTTQAGTINTLLQSGYAVGLILISPLGDMVNRKRLIVSLTVFLIILSLALGFISFFPLFQALNFLMGVLTVIPQIVIPFASELTPPNRRGAVLGMLTSGFLVGILAARIVAGAITEALNYRWVYYLAAIVQTLLLPFMYFFVPDEPHKSVASATGHSKRTGVAAVVEAYARLLGSMVGLLKSQPVLLQACFMGFCQSSSFANFWATSTFLLAGPPYNYSTSVIGLLALAGIVGILTAPFIGRLADKVSISTMESLGSIGLMATWLMLKLAGERSFAAVCVGAFCIDVFGQFINIVNRKRILTLVPSANARINAVFMFLVFMGMTAGSSVGTTTWTLAQWSGPCFLGLACGAGALAAFLFIVDEEGEWRYKAAKRWWKGCEKDRLIKQESISA
ncbi:MFS general substrate transporter [Gonapodya prolifera JEL478]|uniref:MFS general substrate transporter n=1 Tax=Gonapodya prolifera (strain JEL478) TaxID=1344416 RepID=A0A139A0L8_GONPJ|nr:MFS general substrate transporter [Gonapodya prolifera JEL478]|eukprot:KXS10168.1 MFS general substrate transporter [Gonapodya prolifera JEL478]